MRRAFLDRPITVGEWRRRHPLDINLPAGYFRKGRRARGCPRRCVHCLMLRLQPTRQQARADLAWGEWQAEPARPAGAIA